MPSKSPYKSRASAEEAIKRIFANTSEDLISLEELFRIWGRDVTKVEENKQWLSNKLTNWKYHNLIIPVYASRNNRRVLDKLQLTLEGKRMLGRIGQNVTGMNRIQHEINGNGKTVDFRNVKIVIDKLKEANPEFEFNFEMRLKTDKQ